MVPLTFELKKFNQGYSHVIGTDEVGRGCLAGPVVAAAVVFDDTLHKLKGLEEVNDSKLLKPSVREKLSEAIKNAAVAWSVGVVSPRVIDRVNIHQASLRAMRESVKNLSAGGGASFLFVDGKFAVPDIGLDQQAVIGGDAKVFSVACASIVAKVYRDQLMQKLHVKLPQYGFSQHKGYATAHHRTMIAKHGLSIHHRKSFCKNYMEADARGQIR